MKLKHTLRLLVLMGAAMMTGISLQAQETPPFVVVIDVDANVPKLTDDELWERAVAIEYPVGKAVMNPQDAGYRRLVKTASQLKDRDYALCCLLVMRGSASPDGNYRCNELLAHRRARTLKDSLSLYIPLADSLVEERYMAEDYAGLRRLVIASDAPYREAVVKAIDNNRTPTSTKAALRRIEGGQVWKLLLHDYYPRLRAVRVILFVSSPKREEKQPADAVETGEAAETEISETQKPVIAEPSETKEAVTDTAVATSGTIMEQQNNRANILPQKEKTPLQPMLNVKTNLLYDLALVVPQYGWAPTPNISLEFMPRDGHITAVAEWMGSGWRSDKRLKTYILKNLLLEGRYYLQGDAAYTGHYLAAYGNLGEFDIQFSATKAWINDKFGKAWGCGIGWGYVKRIGQSPWKWEVNAAVGYLHTPYDSYHPAEDWAVQGNFYYNWHDDPTKFEKRRSTFNYFGLTRLGISISYDLPWFGWKK